MVDLPRADKRRDLTIKEGAYYLSVYSATISAHVILTVKRPHTVRSPDPCAQ
jgi:hypothetical protein